MWTIINAEMNLQLDAKLTHLQGNERILSNCNQCRALNHNCILLDPTHTHFYRQLSPVPRDQFLQLRVVK